MYKNRPVSDTSEGKTALCDSFLNLEFREDMLITIGTNKFETKYILKNGKNIKLFIWDTPGGERFRSASLKTLRPSIGIILVFDVTKKSTFDNLNDWLDQIKQTYYNPRLVLFGNKVDRSDYRVVSTEEAKKYAESHNLTYYEVSAKTKQGMDEGFSYIINDIYENLDEVKTEISIVKPPIEEKSEPQIEEKSGCAGKTKYKDIKNKKSK